MVKILPGEYYVSRSDEAISTVLGSCMSACVRDPARGLGGMNHFMLPEDACVGPNDWLDPAVGLATRYGSYAMESLINDLLKLGAARERLEIKLFGGGRILAAMTDVGGRNVDFIRNLHVHRGLSGRGRRPRRYPAAQSRLLSRDRPRAAAQAASGGEPDHQSSRAALSRQPRQAGRRRRRRAVRSESHGHDSHARDPRVAPAAKRPIRVLIVDDSALVRSLLTDILNAAAASRSWASRPMRMSRARKSSNSTRRAHLDVECRRWTASPFCAT